MSESQNDLTVSVRTNEFEQATRRLCDAVEELEEAVNEVEVSSVFIDAPTTDGTRRIDIGEILDVEISISLSVGDSDERGIRP